ncbi:profilin-4-like isoform X1 [Halichondria panicea]|uniref:profilin-4-like isoform X1 n=1 Tax=Halichondria panicea TaxID=6063 RepID=UPI00312B8843
MNTLQSLLHESLIATGHVESCTLFKKDRTIKASSIGYEMDSLVEAFHNPISAREHGIQFNGASYKCVRADKDSIYAKKEGSGFIAVKTNSMVIFGTYSSSMYPSVCVEAVEKLDSDIEEIVDIRNRKSRKLVVTNIKASSLFS